jgi:uncharacterized protein YndB with AHSA1/START domain
MTTRKTTTSTEGRDLVLTRILDAPRDRVFQAWTDPREEKLRQQKGHL